jgi:hypothetical protein
MLSRKFGAPASCEGAAWPNSRGEVMKIIRNLGGGIVIANIADGLIAGLYRDPLSDKILPDHVQKGFALDVLRVAASCHAFGIKPRLASLYDGTSRAVDSHRRDIESWLKVSKTNAPIRLAGAPSKMARSTVASAAKTRKERWRSRVTAAIRVARFQSKTPLLRNTRKTECGAIGSWTGLRVRAAAFALLRNTPAQRSLARWKLQKFLTFGGAEPALCGLLSNSPQNGVRRRSCLGESRVPPHPLRASEQQPAKRSLRLGPEPGCCSRELRAATGPLRASYPLARRIWLMDSLN